jgi:hypothetical protein
MIRRCWTCNVEHEPDEPCRQFPAARTARAVGGTHDLFDDAEQPAGPRFGPIFMATYESNCASCGDFILQGEGIRADGQGGWIHADDDCERMAW